MISEVVLYLIGFLIFIVLQSITINGVYDCFKGSKVVDDVSGKVHYQGMIFYMIAPKFLETNKHKTWSKPIYSCVRCMASFWGAVTYWPIVIYLWGFLWIEVFIFVMDVFALVYLNLFFYKKL